MSALWVMPTNTRGDEVNLIAVLRLAAERARRERAEETRQKYETATRETLTRERFGGKSSPFKVRG